MIVKAVHLVQVSVLTRLSVAGLLTQPELAEWLRYRTGLSVGIAGVAACNREV